MRKNAVSKDRDGERAHALLFRPGTGTKAVNGSKKRSLDELTVRVTDVSTGNSGRRSMPADLPGTSAFTYAVDLSVTEGEGDSIEFDQPVVNYVDNFLGFPSGTPVPAGYYNGETDQYICGNGQDDPARRRRSGT